LRITPKQLKDRVRRYKIDLAKLSLDRDLPGKPVSIAARIAAIEKSAQKLLALGIRPTRSAVADDLGIAYHVLIYWAWKKGVDLTQHGVVDDVHGGRGPAKGVSIPGAASVAPASPPAVKKNRQTLIRLLHNSFGHSFNDLNEIVDAVLALDWEEGPGKKADPARAKHALAMRLDGAALGKIGKELGAGRAETGRLLQEAVYQHLVPGIRNLLRERVIQSAPLSPSPIISIRGVELFRCKFLSARC
jgi:hypothetical protein